VVVLALNPLLAPSAQVPDGATTAYHLPIAQRIVALVRREMDTSGLAGRKVTVKHLRETVSDAVTKLNGGMEVLLMVNSRSFAFGRGGRTLDDVLSREVVVPATAKGLTFNAALRLAVGQFPGEGATYVVRRETIEIGRTVSLSTSTEEPVTITNRPLKDALKELAEKTAIPIRVDSHAAGKLRTAVTATIRPKDDLRAAIGHMADRAGLAVALRDGEFVITTPANAKRLMKHDSGK
jgi:hypothetical protein